MTSAGMEKTLTEHDKKEIIEALKQLEGIKRKLHALLKGDAK